MAARAFVSRFSPNRTDPAVLEAIFVQRHRLAEVWLERLRDSVLTGTRHHLLAVGPRGCGKSHLVVLLLHRLRQDLAISERVRVAWLPEDETTPSFWKFLLRIQRALEAAYGEEFPPPPRERLTRATDADRSAVLIDYLLEHLGDRVLLVVVENLDDVMRGLGSEGQKRWRAFLQEHRVAATLATAQQLTKDLSDRDRPFFNFFQIERLQPLSADEALSLLQKLAEQSSNTELAAFLQSPVGRARIRAIRHLTGGSHRIFIILSEFATRENLDDLVSAFEELLDELTPYYQERLRWLPDQQREIVEFLCRQAQTVTVKKIAEEVYLSEPAAAAQLKGLRDKGYVTAASVGRESRYELAEPLMRLCVEVKDPRREPIRLIVEFLRVWYDQESVQARLECLPDGAVLENRYFRAVLQSYQPRRSDPVNEALNRDLEAARTAGDADELVRVLADLGATTQSSRECAYAANELFELARYVEALSVYERALELDPTSSVSWNNMGVTLSWLHRHAEALLAYERTLELDPANGVSWANKGVVLCWLDRQAEALTAYERSLELDSTNSLTWWSKGYTFFNLGRYSEAFVAGKHALKLDPESIEALKLMSFAATQLGQYADALDFCDRLLRQVPHDGQSYANQGHARLRMGQIEGAIEDFEAAIGLDGDTARSYEGLAEAYLVQHNWRAAMHALSERFRLPGHVSRNYSWHLPRFLATLFHLGPVPNSWREQVGDLVELVEQALDYWQEKQLVSESATGETALHLDPLALLGNALVRSLKENEYHQASAEALDGWIAVWNEMAERQTGLVVAVRLFSVGLHYLRTQDQRVLLDLVQEERAILRDLFELDEDAVRG